MGKRNTVFTTARECVNYLDCEYPTEEMSHTDFGLCMVHLTRHKLMHILHVLISEVKHKCIDTSTLLRYYKLNKVHLHTLKKYNCEENEIIFILKLSSMMNNLIKNKV